MRFALPYALSRRIVVLIMENSRLTTTSFRRSCSSSCVRHIGVLTLFALQLLSITAAGCAWKGGPNDQANATAANAWQPQPVAIRVYPTSRFVENDGATILEARIELIDAMEDPIKGAGQFRFDVYTNAGSIRKPLVGEKLYTWDVPLLSLIDQRQHYDRITQAYLFRLKLYDINTAQRATLLRTIFTPITGNRLEAEAVLNMR